MRFTSKLASFLLGAVALPSLATAAIISRCQSCESRTGYITSSIDGQALNLRGGLGSSVNGDLAPLQFVTGNQNSMLVTFTDCPGQQFSMTTVRRVFRRPSTA